MALTAPAVLELLADRAPRSQAAVAAALAGRHPKDDVVRALMRVAAPRRVAEAGERYTLAAADPAPEEA